MFVFRVAEPTWALRRLLPPHTIYFGRESALHNLDHAVPGIIPRVAGPIFREKYESKRGQKTGVGESLTRIGVLTETDLAWATFRLYLGKLFLVLAVSLYAYLRGSACRFLHYAIVWVVGHSGHCWRGTSSQQRRCYDIQCRH